ncbi:hypothetical protein DPMN_023671 [Dreissena polymorpha]|uniref:Uncharacterized protein n=1 Tax=Dreissena polymorpha TaxID=45954 RepID=A0A9D4LL57_DREPO|nr:hypothetical protein DPMN_023671 [Dreissena polymorpha]
MIQFIETSRETQTSDSWSAENISVRLDHSTVKTRTALKWILSICVVARKYVFVAGSALGSINVRTQQNINKILLCLEVLKTEVASWYYTSPKQVQHNKT